MDLIYGNDGMNYRVFGRSRDLSGEAAAKIQSSYMGYRFPANAAAYSSITKEPEAFYYVTSNLGGALQGEKVVLVKNGIMTQFTTPSFYCQAHVIDSDDSFYRSEFFRVFRASFVTPGEASSMNDENINHYALAFDEMVQENALTRDQIRAILYMFFYNERKGSPVRILVDKCGDDYNRRAREVLNCIYHYLPYDLRKRFGFASYMDENQGSLARIGFELYDRTQMKSTEAIDVDLAAPAADAARSRLGKPDVCDFLDRLVDMSEEERIEEFDHLSELFGSARFDMNEAVASSVFEKTWREQPVLDLIPEWASYLLKNGFRKGPVYFSLIRIIQERLNSETFNDYLMDKITEAGADLLALPENIRQIILMADVVDGLDLDVDRFVEYDLNKRGGSASVETLEAIKAKAESLNVGSEEYKAVTKGIADVVSADLEEKRAILAEEKAREEKARLEEETRLAEARAEEEKRKAEEEMKDVENFFYFNACDFSTEYAGEALAKAGKAWASQTARESFVSRLEAEVETELDKKLAGETKVEDRQEMFVFLGKIKKIVSADYYEKQFKKLEDASRRYVEARTPKEVELKSGADLKKLILAIEEKKQNADLSAMEEPELRVRYGEDPSMVIKLAVSDAEKIVDFVLTPSGRTAEALFNLPELQETFTRKNFIRKGMRQGLFLYDQTFELMMVLGSGTDKEFLEETKEAFLEKYRTGRPKQETDSASGAKKPHLEEPRPEASLPEAPVREANSKSNPLEKNKLGKSSRDDEEEGKKGLFGLFGGKRGK